MLIIEVKESGSLERALKLLKRKFEKTGTLEQLRERKTYQKPSVKNRETKLGAIYKNKYAKGN